MAVFGLGGESFDCLKDAVELFFLGNGFSKPKRSAPLDIVGGDVLDAPPCNVLRFIVSYKYGQG